MATQFAVHIARGSSYFIIQTVATNLISILSFAVLTRLITTEQMGILAVLQLMISLCGNIGSFSLPSAVIKFVAEHWERGDKSSAASVFYQALRTTLILSVPLAVAVYFGAPVLSAALLHQAAYTAYFHYLAFDIVLTAGLEPVLFSGFVGLQKFRQQATVLIVNAAIRQGLIITLIILLHDFFGLVVAWVLADLTVTITCYAYLLRILGGPKFNFEIRRLLSFSWPLWLRDGVSFASGWFDRALLLIFVPLATLGIYNATLTAFSVLGGIGSAAAGTLLPAFSSMHQTRREDLVSSLARSTRYASFLLVPLAFGLFATAKPALTLFVGQAYLEGAEPLMILAGTYAFTAVAVVISPMLLALGESRLASLSSVITVIVSFAFALVLAPPFGMFGAATARCAGMIFGTISVILFLKRRMQLQFDVDGIKKSLIAGAVMAGVLFFIETLFYSRFMMPVYIAIGGIVYLAMLRFLKAIRKDDIDLISSYLGPRMAFASNLLSILLSPTGEK